MPRSAAWTDVGLRNRVYLQLLCHCEVSSGVCQRIYLLIRGRNLTLQNKAKGTGLPLLRQLSSVQSPNKKYQLHHEARAAALWSLWVSCSLISLNPPLN